MIPKYAVNPVGLKRRQTFEELTQAKPFPIFYPDRSATILRNSREVSNLLNMSMYELEENQQRQMMERQKLDLLRTIANSSSDFTFKHLKLKDSKSQTRFTATKTTGADAEVFKRAEDEIEANEMEQQQTRLGRRKKLVRTLVEQFDIAADDDVVKPFIQDLPIEVLPSGSGDIPSRMSAAEMTVDEAKGVFKGSGEDPNRMSAAAASTSTVGAAMETFKGRKKKKPLSEADKLRNEQALRGLADSTPTPKKKKDKQKDEVLSDTAVEISKLRKDAMSPVAMDNLRAQAEDMVFKGTDKDIYFLMGLPTSIIHKLALDRDIKVIDDETNEYYTRKELIKAIIKKDSERLRVQTII